MALFENGFGKIEFDDTYLEYDVDVMAAVATMTGPLGKLGINQMTKIVANVTGAPKRSTGKIRIELVDSVKLYEMSKGYKATNPIFNPSIGARIVIVTASGGLAGNISMYIEKNRVNDARDFVEQLQNSVLNRGRKVEVIGDSTEEEMKICPDCAESVKAAARKCRYCSYIFG